jgi:hypothetical protein
LCRWCLHQVFNLLVRLLLLLRLLLVRAAVVPKERLDVSFVAVIKINIVIRRLLLLLHILLLLLLSLLPLLLIPAPLALPGLCSCIDSPSLLIIL